MKNTISMMVTTVLLIVGAVSYAQAQDFFAPDNNATQKGAPAQPADNIQPTTSQVYQQWLKQYQQLQQKTLQQRTINPSQYNLPVPHQTGNH